MWTTFLMVGVMIIMLLLIVRVSEISTRMVMYEKFVAEAVTRTELHQYHGPEQQEPAASGHLSMAAHQTL